MSAAGLVSATPPAPAPPGAPAPAMPPGPEYYEEEELESAEEEDGDRSARARDSDEVVTSYSLPRVDTEDASETDLAKHEEEDFVEMKEQMYQDKLASLKRQLQQLQEGTLQEYQKRMKKLDQQYKERIRNAELFLQLETDQVEKNYVKEKKAAAKEFEDKKIELKENLIAELEEKKKMIENEKLTMELTGDSMEVKPIMTRKLRRRPNDPVPIPDKRRKPAPDILSESSQDGVFAASVLPASVLLYGKEDEMRPLRMVVEHDFVPAVGVFLMIYLLYFMYPEECWIMLKSPKRPASPSSPEHLPATPAESPAQRFEARIEDGKLYYDKRWYHKSQAIYLESKENTKISCVISSVGANEIWVRKTSDSTKMRIYLGQLQRGVFVIRRRSAA
ncbi:Suds3 [Columba guinea]|nr:Suds3 [Columba guinea]